MENRLEGKSQLGGLLWDGEEKTVKRFKLKVGKENKSLSIDFKVYKQKYPKIRS